MWIDLFLFLIPALLFAIKRDAKPAEVPLRRRPL